MRGIFEGLAGFNILNFSSDLTLGELKHLISTLINFDEKDIEILIKKRNKKFKQNEVWDFLMPEDNILLKNLKEVRYKTYFQIVHKGTFQKLSEDSRVKATFQDGFEMDDIIFDSNITLGKLEEIFTTLRGKPVGLLIYKNRSLISLSKNIPIKELKNCDKIMKFHIVHFEDDAALRQQLDTELDQYHREHKEECDRMNVKCKGMTLDWKEFAKKEPTAEEERIVGDVMREFGKSSDFWKDENIEEFNIITMDDKSK